MKKNKKYIALSLIALTSLVASATATIAWFMDNGVDVAFGNGTDTFIQGGTEKGLFGGGDGSEDHPWQIKTPGQLYNLAWAYYLGKYATEDPNTGKLVYQYNYFELDVSNLDMSGYTLPPIGTEDHPFVASFDGKGNKISNLTVSNTFSDFGNAHPSQVDNAFFTNNAPEVIGFFGAIGPIPTNTNYSNYSSTDASLTDLTLENLAVKSDTNKTLIGLAAGYVDGNMSGVKISGNKTSLSIGQSSVANFSDDITQKLSDYSLVGFAANPSDTRTFSQSISAYYDADNNTTGMDADWGGSVDMLSVFQRLYNFKYYATNNTQSAYNYNVSPIYGGDKLISQTIHGTMNTYRYQFDTDPEHTRMGNYNIFNHTSSPNSRMYVGGGHWERSRTSYPSYLEYVGYKITDGMNYLNCTTSLSNGTNNSNATIWNLAFSGDSSTSTIVSYYNGSAYYLMNSNGDLGVSSSTDNPTVWTITSNGNNLDIESGNYRLVYRNGWKLLDKTYSDTYNVISYTTGGTTYYISKNGLSSGSTPNSTTNIDEAAHFIRAESGGYTYLVTNDSGSNLYLCNYYYVDDSGCTSRTYNDVQMYVSANSESAHYYGFYLANDGRIKSRADANYYLYCTTTGNWDVNESNTNSATFTSHTINYSDFHLSSFGDAISNTVPIGTPTTTNMNKAVFLESDTTYFPLNVAQDGGSTTTNNFASYVENGNYDPTYKNTGYVVGGSKLSNTTNLGTDASNMRFSQYELAKIANSYDNTYTELDDSKIYTVCGTGTYTTKSMQVRMNTDNITYNRYGASKAKFFETLKKDDTNVSGFHFNSSSGTDSAVVSTDNIVRVQNAFINGTAYEDGYDLPVFSIDFNLKKNGYVNFFAGTYHGGDVADCFFSLYQVFRDSSDKTRIQEIKEISQVYKKDGTDTETDVVYKYSTDSSSWSAPTGYSLVFDTMWIKRSGALTNNQKAIFYFEIPTNAGEYCLGNVSGGDGGYLLYLDIGANGAQVLHGITAYSITTLRNGTVFPTGVDFLVVGVDEYDDGGYSFGLSIDENNSAAGSISFNISESQVSLTDTLSSNYSFQGTKWKSTARDGYFYVSGSSPGAPPRVLGGEKVSYISILEGGTTYSVRIVDTLSANGSIIESKYFFEGTEVTLRELQTNTAAASALQDNVIDLIRSLRTIATLTSEGSNEFNSQPNYSYLGNTDYKTVNIIISETGFDITIAFILDGYSIYINGTAVAQGNTHTLP